MEPVGQRPPAATAPEPEVRIAGPRDLSAIDSLVREIMAEHGIEPPAAEALRATLEAILSGDRCPVHSPSQPASVGRPGAHTPPGQTPPPTGPADPEREHVFLVVEHRGSVVGMCALLFSLSTWSATRVCELQDVIVSAPQRGRGLGRALLEAAAATARARGCTRVFLTAEAFNLPAHGVYRALGFGEKTVLYFERSV